MRWAKHIAIMLSIFSHAGSLQLNADDKRGDADGKGAERTNASNFPLISPVIYPFDPNNLEDRYILPAQQNIVDLGYGGSCERGWYDVQGQGICNDYCRWVGNCGCGGSCSRFDCALAGSSSIYTGNDYGWARGSQCPHQGAETRVLTVTGQVGPSSAMLSQYNNVRAVLHRSDFTLWIFAVYHGGYTKMVGVTIVNGVETGSRSARYV
ncbi:unnamed protein product [Prorocentrum cordatum]|uniref:Cellulase n=1 Tax=Prorocentrum cordatum TaxID=2364126 RepID=A0ABN9X9Y9_9DINO|nr:unnamed protein product [Polarella glacialis]